MPNKSQKEAVESPSASAGVASSSDLKAPIPELEGAFPVVIYFRNDTDREEFIEMVKEAKPNMVARKL